MGLDASGSAANMESRPAADAAAGAPSNIEFAAVMKSPTLVAQATEAPTAPAANPSDPRVAMHDRISQLYTVVENEEKDPKLKVSWDHGVHLRELGSLNMQTGDLVDGRLCLQAAAQTMHEAPDKPKDAEMTITEALVDYGHSLMQPMPRENMAARQKDLTDAQAIFGSVAERAEAEHRSPEDVAAMWQLKANSDIAMADTFNPGNPVGKEKYVANMTAAITDLNSGLDKVKGRDGQDSKLTQARLHGELGYAESQVNAKDRNNWNNYIWGAGLFGAGRYDADGDYKQAVDLWHQYNPGNNKQGQAIKDEELLTTLDRYSALLTTEGDKSGAAKVEQESQSIQAKHPNWQVKL